MSDRIPVGFADASFMFRCAGDSEVMLCSLGLELTGGGVPSVGEVTSFFDACNIPFKSFISDQYLIGPGYWTYGQAGGDIRIDAASTPVQGESASVCFPPNTAWLVQKQTALGGRRNRGRMYIPGVGVSFAEANGVLTSAGRTLIRDGMDELLTAVAGESSVQEAVLFHQSAPFTPTPLVAASPSIRLATQRRRLRP